MTALDPARREELAEALTNEHAEGWYAAPEHDPGCPGGDESYCMSHCPVPVQARTGPHEIADALAPLIARWLADARADGAAEVRARVEAVLDRKPHYYAKALENGVRAALADPPPEPAP